MNLILHILKKDIRRMRFLLVLWAVLILFQSMMAGMKGAATTGNIGWQLILSYIQFLVPMLQWIALSVMIPLLIHEEPLTGTTAFWFTRPLSGRMLLKEKSLFIGGFFLGAPLLTEVLVLAANGITLHHILLAVPEIILKQLSMVFLIAGAAVITPNFAKFVQVAAAGFIGQMLLGYLLMISRTLRQEGLDSFYTEQALSDSCWVVTALLTLFLGAFLMAHQYLTRRTRKTLLYALPCIMAGLGAHYFWPWNFLEQKQESVAKNTINSDAVSLSFDGDSIYDFDESQWSSQTNPKKAIWGDIEVDGGEIMDFIQPKKVDAVLAFPDGKSFSYNTPDKGTLSISEEGGDHGGEAIQSTLSPVELVNKKKTGTTTVFEIDDKTYQQYVNTPGAYTAKVTLSLSRYQVEGELPLKRGSRLKIGSEYAVITDVLHQPHGVNVVMRDQTVNLVFDANRPAHRMEFFSSNKDVVYVLQNKKRGQAFLPKNDNHFSLDDYLESDQRLRTSSLVQQYTSLSENYEKQDLPEITEEWLQDATLVRLRRVEMGTFTKPLVVTKFFLSNKSNRPENPGEKNRNLKLREAEALVTLANVYSDSESYAKAEPLYTSAEALQTKYSGSDSPELADALMYHAIMYGKEKKAVQALALNERILAIKEKNDKVTTPAWDALFKDLADLCAQNKNRGKAEAYLKRGIEICGKKYGVNDARTLKLTESLKNLSSKALVGKKS